MGMIDDAKKKAQQGTDKAKEEAQKGVKGGVSQVKGKAQNVKDDVEKDMEENK